MSTFLPTLQRRPKKTIADLNPRQALRRQGNYEDFYDRMRATLRLTADLGGAGLQVVGPYLTDFIADYRNLRIALDHMRLNGGRSIGPDEVQLLDFAEQDIWIWLRAIETNIKEGAYQVTAEDERTHEIPKRSGRGHRELTIQNQDHRLVQRAALQVLGPLLDSKLGDYCFGGRPGRGPHMALATAERLFHCEQRHDWVTEDLCDAYRCVSLPRVTQVFARQVPDGPMLNLLKQMLSGSRTPGLRQGGALSPLLLAIYLEHLLLRRWRQQMPDVPLLLYVDDILLMCRSKDEACAARQTLFNLLQGTGFRFKGTEAATVRPLMASKPAEWLGFQIRKEGRRLFIQIPASAHLRLCQQLKLLDVEQQRDVDADVPDQGHIDTLGGWINYYGPCLVSNSERRNAFNQLMRAFEDRAVSRSINFDTFDARAIEAAERWMDVRHRVTIRSRVAYDVKLEVPDWLTDWD